MVGDYAALGLLPGDRPPGEPRIRRSGSRSTTGPSGRRATRSRRRTTASSSGTRRSRRRGPTRRSRSASTCGAQSRDAPEGIVSIDSDTLHTWRPFYLGKIRRDGQFDIVWSLEKPIRPVPFPMFRSQAYWEAFRREAVQDRQGPGRRAPPSSSPRPRRRESRRPRRSGGLEASAGRRRHRRRRPPPSLSPSVQSSTIHDPLGRRHEHESVLVLQARHDDPAHAVVPRDLADPLHPADRSSPTTSRCGRCEVRCATGWSRSRPSRRAELDTFASERRREPRDPGSQIARPAPRSRS